MANRKRSASFEQRLPLVTQAPAIGCQNRAEDLARQSMDSFASGQCFSYRLFSRRKGCQTFRAPECKITAAISTYVVTPSVPCPLGP